uniref:Acetylglutamate kinase n=1 Tax=Leiomenia cribrosa TaxID=217483 RepID=A0A4D6WVB6_9FLOR|nr:acetylglutamate kinase [Leiomenia cribrosa]
MLNSDQKIEFLSQILPFIKKLSGRIIVIKYGGAAMKNDDLTSKVLDNVLLLSSIGVKVVLVHGGGPMINHWLKKCNIEPKFYNGIRITDEDTMEIVEMVLVGKVNKKLVSMLNTKKQCAVGLSGKDGNLAIASRLFKSEENFVGEINAIDIKVLNLLIKNNYIPIIASIAADKNGQTYNINADTFAGILADALSAEKLVFLTDIPGIMYDINDIGTLIKSINIDKIKELKEEKIISGGMIPKVDCCINAVKGNVKSAHIIDGKVHNGILLELFTNERIGSMITFE